MGSVLHNRFAVMRKQKLNLSLFQPSVNNFFNVSLAFRVSTFTLKVVSIHVMKAYRESRGIAPLVFNLSSAHLWKEPRYPHIRRLGVPQSWSWHFGNEKYFLALPGFKPQNGQPVAQSQYQLRYSIPAQSTFKVLFSTTHLTMYTIQLTYSVVWWDMTAFVQWQYGSPCE